MIEREKVYEAIDSERKYQDSKWAEHNHNSYHEVESWLMYMEHYIDKAKEIVSTKPEKEAYAEALHHIRKVAALAVACMENYGAPLRQQKPQPWEQYKWFVDYCPCCKAKFQLPFDKGEDIPEIVTCPGCKHIYRRPTNDAEWVG